MTTRPPRRLTLQQTAMRLGVHEQTVRRWVKRGLLRSMITPAASKYGQRHRFLESEVEKFVQRHLRGPHRIEAPRIESGAKGGNGRDRGSGVRENSPDDKAPENLY